jgi:hypothetical protein
MLGSYGEGAIMSAHDDYLDPDHHDCQSHAFQAKIGGLLYAWDEDDNVYRVDPDSPSAREDGYRWIGKLAWPEDDQHPSAVLKEFARSYQAGEQNPNKPSDFSWFVSDLFNCIGLIVIIAALIFGFI